MCVFREINCRVLELSLSWISGLGVYVRQGRRTLQLEIYLFQRKLDDSPAAAAEQWPNRQLHIFLHFFVKCQNSAASSVWNSTFTHIIPHPPNIIQWTPWLQEFNFHSLVLSLVFHYISLHFYYLAWWPPPPPKHTDTHTLSLLRIDAQHFNLAAISLKCCHMTDRRASYNLLSSPSRLKDSFLLKLFSFHMEKSHALFWKW